MNDPYLYAESSVLRNLLDIRDGKELEFAEAELSRARMMLLYEAGFDDFSTSGMKKIHKALFGEIYDWAGEFRIINIRKREKILAGKSVWYATDEDIERDIEAGWAKINNVSWAKQECEEFAKKLARTFPLLWQAQRFADVLMQRFYKRQKFTSLADAQLKGY